MSECLCMQNLSDILKMISLCQRISTPPSMRGAEKGPDSAWVQLLASALGSNILLTIAEDQLPFAKPDKRWTNFTSPEHEYRQGPHVNLERIGFSLFFAFWRDLRAPVIAHCRCWCGEAATELVVNICVMAFIVGEQVSERYIQVSNAMFMQERCVLTPREPNQKR